MSYKRIVATAFGDSSVLSVETVKELPKPRDGEVRVKILTTSAAFTDVMIRKGMYPDVKDKPPLVLGYDMVGVVDKLGPDARKFKIGQCVADLTTTGSYSEYLCLPEKNLTPVPDGVDPVQAVSCILSFITPYQMLHRVAKIKSGQSILIHGAGGAVGTAMLQLAGLANVTAFGTDIKAKHKLITSLNATPIDCESEDLEKALETATGGGVDVVFDAIGGECLSRSLHILKPGGLLVCYGFQNAVLGVNGSIPMDYLKLKLWDLLPNGHATAFYSIGAMRRSHPKWFKEDLSTMLDLLNDGYIQPIIGATLPLIEARKAHDLIEAGEVEGKVVLIVAVAADSKDSVVVSEADSSALA